MADTVIKPARGAMVMAKWFKKLGLSANGPKAGLAAMINRCWYAASADPAVDAGSQATYPVQVGDPAYRVDSDEAFICSVAPTANTAATFVQLNA
jgi:hypothetical protein